MAHTLVLGLGNDILTDDAVGLIVANKAASQLAHIGGIEVKTTTEMGLALLDEIVEREALVLVDSIQTNQQPAGYVHSIEPKDLSRLQATSPHFLGVRETLELGERLGLTMPEKVAIVAIEVADPFTLGTDLTEEVGKAVPIAVRHVVDRALAFASTNSGAINHNKNGQGGMALH